MRRDTLINLRISSELKENFQAIVGQEGFGMSEVLEASMKDIVRRGMVPINIRSQIERPQRPVISIPFIKSCLEDIMSSKKGEKVRSVSLFGSYSKGTATKSSDVDLFLEFDDELTLMELADLQMELEKALGKKVDLVTDSSDPYFMSHIQKEKIRLYERIA